MSFVFCLFLCFDQDFVTFDGIYKYNKKQAPLKAVDARKKTKKQKSKVM